MPFKSINVLYIANKTYCPMKAKFFLETGHITGEIELKVHYTEARARTYPT